MNLIAVSPRRARTYRKRRRYQSIKRIIEVLCCLIALPFVAPLMLVCAILIRLDSPGPAIFVQERIGKHGKRFKIRKFRTMQHNLDNNAHEAHRAFMKAFVNGQLDAPEEDEGHIFKPFDSSQVTKIGRVLRKTSLDELPQIWNVLMGDMSIIGPRPNVLWEVEEYKPWHYKRLEVLPGITGLAQVKGRSSISFDEIAQHDIAYIDRESLGLDLKILWWTFTAVFSGEGAS